MNYVDIFYLSDDGLRLCARDYPGPGSDAPRQPMLALRGETSDILSAHTLHEMAPRPSQLTAITVTGRGHAPTLNEHAARATIMPFLAAFTQTKASS